MVKNDSTVMVKMGVIGAKLAMNVIVKRGSLVHSEL